MESTNRQLITKFYSCFQNKDYKGMQECYADNALFSDPVFVNLNSEQVKAMWEMLCLRSKDLKIEYKDITAEEKHASAEWTAHYTFSVSGKMVINHINASFLIENGKIIKHIDSFSFYKWSKQAIGTPGILLGWTNFLKNKVRSAAMKSLVDFMNKKGTTN